MLKYKYKFLLLILSLISLLLLNTILQINTQDNLCIDCENYLESAYYLYQNFSTHYYRPIGISILYGFPILFGLNNYADINTVIISLNVILYIGIILTFFSICKLFISEKKSFFFSILLISFFGISLHIQELLSEIPFLFCILNAFKYLTKYYLEHKSKFIFYSLTLFLFCILIRPGILYFSILIVLIHTKIILKTYNFKNLIILSLPLLLISFQIIKMKEKYGNYTISYIDSVTYYNYLGSKAICLKENKTLNQNTNKRADYIYKQTHKNAKEIAFTDLYNQLENNTYYLFRAYIDDIEENTKTATSNLQFYKNMSNDKNFNLKVKIISEITEWQNKLLTLFGLILSIYFCVNNKKQNKIIAIFALYFLYVFFISGVSSTQGDRFHIVFYPIVVLLAALYLKNTNTITNKYAK